MTELRRPAAIRVNNRFTLPGRAPPVTRNLGVICRRFGGHVAGIGTWRICGIPGGLALVVCGLSLYFAGLFGTDASKALLALEGKFPDLATGAIASAVINTFALPPHHLVTIWAALAAAKLAVAGFFLLAVSERLSADTTQGVAAPDYDAQNLALHGAFGLTVLLLIPSLIGGDGGAVRSYAANLMLLAITAAITIIDRHQSEREPSRVGHLDAGDLFQATADAPLPTGKAPRT